MPALDDADTHPAQPDGSAPLTARDISVVGFAATAVSYGPARMGFGLHLPQLAEEYDLSDVVAGMMSGGIFASFLLAAVAGSWLVAARGPRFPVLLGCACAAAGLSVAAVAPGVGLLALGLVVAGASAGLCWTPFNDAAARALPESARGTTLSMVSTGTTMGIAVAGGAQLVLVVAGPSWRAAVTGYAVAGVVAGVLALVLMTPIPARPGETGVRPEAVRRLGAPLAWPVGAAISFGLTSALYLTFATDLLTAAGGLAGVPTDGASGVLFIAYGVGGLLGLATAEVESRVGLRVMLALVFTASAASLALLALSPTTWWGVLVSAGLQGAAVMTTSALLAFWTARLFPTAATTAFTVVILGLALGGVIGPLLAGLLLGPVGAVTVFGLAAGLSVLTGLGLSLADPPRRDAPTER